MTSSASVSLQSSVRMQQIKRPHDGGGGQRLRMEVVYDGGLERGIEQEQGGKEDAPDNVAQPTRSQQIRRKRAGGHHRHLQK